MDLKKLIREALENKDCCTATKPPKAPILNESIQSRTLMTENMQYHIDNKKPLYETTVPYGSPEYINLWAEARYLYLREAINLTGIDLEKITETDLGEYGMFEGQMVPLDMPILDEDILTEAEYQGRKVQLGKPMQGDVKKFKVFVKNAKGKVVKVNFGFGGKSAKGKRMVIKAKNPKARAAYRARHNCKNPGPRWKANYWSCKKW
tara:strand:- start:1359 stop:1976 length:618 start_codon:yes stop_codon:yes gene_type:complete